MTPIGQLVGRYQGQLASKEWAAFSKRIRQGTPYCAHCRTGTSALNVHHIFYDWKRKLWEYEPHEVIVLCEHCHKELQTQLSQFRKYVFRYLNKRTFQLLNGALSVALTQYDPLVFCHALCALASNRHAVENYARSWAREEQQGTEHEHNEASRDPA